MNPGRPQSSSLKVRRPPSKALMVFDGDCGFCRKWVGRWRRLTGDRLDYEPYQKVAKDYPEIPRASFEKAVQLIHPDGSVTEGAGAVFQGMASVPFLGWALSLYRHLPGFAYVSEKAYAFVAGHRHFFSSVDSCGLAAADNRPTYFFPRWIFLKALALVYLAAFGSFWIQVDGLIGSNGILPVDSFLKAVQDQSGAESFLLVPTLCWLNDSNGFLHFICAAGVLLSLLLFLDLAPLVCLPLLWIFYLSLVSVGQDFLSFQWDNLLLEAGFLAIFSIPLQWRTGRNTDNPPSSVVLFLFQWLLFRLMFCSGMVKLASGDPSWRNLTALEYHYETQPLPTPLAWWMNQLPEAVQKFSCLYMFGIELVVPFFILGPRRLRPAAFGLLVSLQILILLTGNYCFFNGLALGLCFFCLEDEAWPRWFKSWWPSKRKEQAGAARHWPSWMVGLVAVLVAYMTFFQVLYTLGARFRLAAPLMAAYEILATFRSANSYGLFAVMTTTRPEIIVSGSNDGVTWRPYEFKWKAGDPRQGPRYVAPYQPRLDWQMWFAALGNYQDNPWFVRFLLRLLEGSPEVLGLLKENPFPEGPPQFIRADLYEYHFTDAAEKSQTGNWWKRQYQHPYMPSFSLEQVRSQGFFK